MAKATTKLNAQDRVILFCAATGINHAAVGILAHAKQSMAVRGFIAHNRESGERIPGDGLHSSFLRVPIATGWGRVASSATPSPSRLESLYFLAHYKIVPKI